MVDSLTLSSWPVARTHEHICGPVLRAGNWRRDLLRERDTHWAITVLEDVFVALVNGGPLGNTNVGRSQPLALLLIISRLP